MGQPDLIWNNAFGESPASALAGDVALHWALMAHGLVANGGVMHAAECLDVQELQAACDGYRWLGLHEVADLLCEVDVLVGADDLDDDAADALERNSNDRYNKLVEDDQALEAAFRIRFADEPEAFASAQAPSLEVINTHGRPRWRWRSSR